MEKNAQQKLFISVVTLHPQAHFSGTQLPTAEEIDQMHQETHEECFIANSVKTQALCKPLYV